MPKAYSYIRMSTQIQLKGDSLNRQLRSSREYAKQHKLELDELTFDIGISAFKGKNIEEGTLGKFLKMIQDGEIEDGSYLLVESLDRLSRNDVLTALTLFTSIINAGITIVTLADNKVYSKETIKKNYTELIISLTIMSRAHEESLQKSQRISKAWESKRNDLDHRKMTSKCPAWLRLPKDKKEFEIIKDRAELIRQIYSDSCNGMGNFAIARRLNERKIKSWGRSKGWQSSYIQRILNNRAVLGEFQPHKLIENKRIPIGEPIKTYYPKIIDEDQFYEVKEGKKNRNIGGGRKGINLSNLFTRIAKCGYCGSSMHFINKGSRPKGGRYLVCDKANRKLGCHISLWKYDDFEINFLTFVAEINLGELFNDKPDTEIENLNKLLTSKKQRYQENQSKIQKFNNLFLEMKEPPISFAENAKALESENSEIEIEIKESERKITRIKKNPQEVLDCQGEIQSFLKKLSSLEADDLLLTRSKISQNIKTLIERIEVFCVGFIKDESRIRILERTLEENGYDESRITDYFKSIEKSYDQKTARHYMVLFKDGSFRFIRPDFNDPTNYVAMETPLTNLGTIPL
jgi:DNA invertase Pin-like site-specific DNA recombinase